MRPRLRVLAFSGLVAASVLGGCGPTDPVAELRERATEVRLLEPRWSGVERHGVCGEPAPDVPHRCASPREMPDVSRWIGLINEVDSVARRGDSSVLALRALAAVDVLTGASGSAGDLDRAVDRLRGAAELAPDDPGARNDLAVALLVRGAVTGRTWDTVEALQHAEEALLIEPRHSEAAFNRALALDRLHLTREASLAWGVLAAATPGDGWTEEAGVRRDAVEARIETDAEAVPEIDALMREIAALLDTGSLEPLPENAWARVRRQAELLAARGERGALDLVDALVVGDGVGDPALAGAMARYVEAMDLWTAGAYAASQSTYRRAQTMADGSSPGAEVLRWRSEIGASRWSVYEAEYSVAEAGFESVVSRTQGIPATETRGHALYGLGLSTGRRGEYETARRYLDVADSLFAALGQKEQYGAARTLKAELLGIHGETAAALDELVAALPLFGRDGGTMHQNLLSITGRLIATRHPRAATAFHREGLALSEARENPQYQVEALIRLAQAEARAGERDRALERLEQARTGLSEIEEGAMRDRVRAEYDELVGMYVPGLEATSRDSLLTAAVAHFGSLGYLYKVPALMERRGRHRLVSGRIEAGRDDLRRALILTDSQLVRTMNPAQRASLVRAKADAIDALVESHLDVGDTLAALVDLDRARAASSLRTAGFWDSARGRRFSAGERAATTAAGGAVVVYAVVEERLLAWTVGSSGVHLTDLQGTAHELERAVSRLQFFLQTAAPVDAVAPLTDSLHAALIAPLAPHLGDVGAVTIVPDGPLHGLPFSVLGGTPGAILDRFALTHAPSLAFALGSPERPSGPAEPTVAATAATGLGPRYSALPVLRFADQEAADVAGLHGVEPLTGPSSEVLAASLERAGLFHFAGHALFRSDRPDLSELVLPGEAGGLSASRISQLDLSGLELAVLAACSTQEADDGRAGGLSGLTWSFLEAGAAGVIGSLWAVPDAATSELMVALHKRLSSDEHAAEALRAVQLDAARSGSGGWGWTAFRYEGVAMR